MCAAACSSKGAHAVSWMSHPHRFRFWCQHRNLPLSLMLYFVTKYFIFITHSCGIKNHKNVGWRIQSLRKCMAPLLFPVPACLFSKYRAKGKYSEKKFHPETPTSVSHHDSPEEDAKSHPLSNWINLVVRKQPNLSSQVIKIL